jgi:prepilin signal peptidase PulO-like enzyme (type II secretory pathway)
MAIPSIIIALILGLSIGSFLNVVIHRLPLSINTKTTLTLNNPKRSFCPLCHTTLSAFELLVIYCKKANVGIATQALVGTTHWLKQSQL